MILNPLNKVSWMSFAAAVLVVVIHVVCDPPAALMFLTRVAVPWFFLISGYFAARELVQRGAGKMLAKRVRTLVLPYVALNAFWFFLLAGLVWLSVRYFGSKEQVAFSIGAFVRALGFDLWHAPVISAFWYVRCLLIFLLILPAIAWGMRKRECFSWCIVICCVVGATAYEYVHCKALPLFGFNIRGLSFFLAGAHLWLWPVRLSRLSGICIALAGVIGFEMAGLPIPAIGATLAMVWFMLPAVSAPGWLRTVTFPIYVLHQMILYCLLIPLRFLKIGGGSALVAMALVALSVGLSIGIARAMSRFCPRIAALVFGGRVGVGGRSWREELELE